MVVGLRKYLNLEIEIEKIKDIGYIYYVHLYDLGDSTKRITIITTYNNSSQRIHHCIDLMCSDGTDLWSSVYTTPTFMKEINGG